MDSKYAGSLHKIVVTLKWRFSDAKFSFALPAIWTYFKWGAAH